MHLSSHLYAVVHEASAVAGRPEMRILFCAGHLDAPYALPGLIKLTVHRVHTWVMGGYSVTHVCGDPMLLKETLVYSHGKPIQYHVSESRIEQHIIWQILTCANCLLSLICSASTLTLWKRWGCMWLHICGNHQNSFRCRSSVSSPSSSSSVPEEQDQKETINERVEVEMVLSV